MMIAKKNDGSVALRARPISKSVEDQGNTSQFLVQPRTRFIAQESGKCKGFYGYHWMVHPEFSGCLFYDVWKKWV